MNGVQANPLFALKAYLNDKPYTCLVIGLTISVIVIGFTLRLFEESRDSLYNTFYLIVVTMTTIGYGDMYPVSYIGRVVCIAS